MTDEAKKVWKVMESEFGWKNKPEGLHLEYFEDIIKATNKALYQQEDGGLLPKSCYYQCKECNKFRMMGTACKNPITKQCDKDERYFYISNDR